MKVKGFKRWMPEDKAKVAELLKAGNTAQQIGDHFGITRNCITGLLARDAELRAVGFTKKGPDGSRKGGVRSKFTPEERLERKRQYSRERERQRRAERRAAREAAQPAQKPFLRVVSNNVPMMVEDWLKQNGGPRRFERGLSADYFGLKDYLADRGVHIENKQGRKLRMATKSGRLRDVTWTDVYAMADKFRVAEGLTPILRRAS